VRQRPPFPRINPRSPLANGLLFASLGGGAGTSQALDSSGFGRNATLSNIDPSNWTVWPNWGTRAISFPSGTPYTRRINLPTFSVPTAYTIGGWARCDGPGTSGFGRLFASVGTTTVPYARAITGTFECYDTQLTTFSYTNGEEFHWANTKTDGQYGRLYKNGVLASTASLYGGTLSVPYYIGNRSDEATPW